MQVWNAQVQLSSSRAPIAIEIQTLLVNHFMEDPNEEKRQECQYPQELKKMKLQARVWRCKLHYEIHQNEVLQSLLIKLDVLN